MMGDNGSSRRGGRWRAWWPYALLVLLVFAFFWDSFLAGKAFVMRDTFADFLPWRIFGREAFRAGTLPLWNPYSHAGQPFIANPQTAFFYPPHLIFYLLPPVFALKVWLAFHLCVAAAFMYALARSWRLGVSASLVAAIGFAFSATTIAVMEFQSLFGVYVWFPAALLLTSRMVDAWESAAGNLKLAVAKMIPPVLGLALVLAMQFLSGYQETFVYSLFIDGVFLIFICAGRGGWKGFVACSAGFVAASALSLGLAMTQFLLTWQLIPLSIRSKTFDPLMDIASLHPRLILCWLMPFLAGHPSHFAEWWGYPKLTMQEFWMGANYVGLAPLVLASFAPTLLFQKQQRRAALLTLFLIALALIGLVFAMGCHTPIYPWCHAHLPLLSRLRWPSKFIQITVFALPLLAGLGMHAFFGHGEALQKRLCTAILFAWLAVWVVMTIAWAGQRNSPEFFAWLTGGAYRFSPNRPELLARLGKDLGWSVIMLGVTVAMLVVSIAEGIPESRRRWIAAFLPLLAFVDLFVVGRQIQPIMDDEIYQSRPTALVAAQAGREPGRFKTAMDVPYLFYGSSEKRYYDFGWQTGAGELSLPDRIHKIYGGETLKLKGYDRIVAALFETSIKKEAADRIFELINLRYDVKVPKLGDVMKGDEKFEIVTVERSLPRAMVVNSWAVQPNEDAAFTAIFSNEFDLYRAILVDRVPAGWPEVQDMPPAPGAPITKLADAGIDQIEYGWNRVDLTARSARRAMLFLDDVAYPGWRASVDGREVPILLADMLFRAVPMEGAGTHRVSFVYWPPQVTIGLSISAATILLMLLLAAFAWRYRKQA